MLASTSNIIDWRKEHLYLHSTKDAEAVALSAPTKIFSSFIKSYPIRQLGGGRLLPHP